MDFAVPSDDRVKKENKETKKKKKINLLCWGFCCSVAVKIKDPPQINFPIVGFAFPLDHRSQNKRNQKITCCVVDFAVPRTIVLKKNGLKLAFTSQLKQLNMRVTVISVIIVAFETVPKVLAKRVEALGIIEETWEDLVTPTHGKDHQQTLVCKNPQC